MQAKACGQAVGASYPPGGKQKMVVGQFGLMALLLLALKHKVLRSYSQAEENACSFYGPQDDEI
jgi:hypothetical protein